MYIDELILDSNICIDLIKDGYKTELETKVIGVYKNKIEIEQIYVDNKKVAFDSSNIYYNLWFYRENDKPILWTNVLIKNFKVKDKERLIVYSEKDGKPTNRRLSYRLDLDIKGTINKKDVIIHDISTTGLSFYDSLDNIHPIGENIIISIPYMYDILTLRGKTIRVESRGTRILYGCTIQDSKDLQEFLLAEQRKRLRKFKGRCL